MDGLGAAFINGVMALLVTILQINAINWSRGNRMKNTIEVMVGLQHLIEKNSVNAEMEGVMKGLQNSLDRDVKAVERAALRRTDALRSAIMATILGVLGVVPMVTVVLNAPNYEVLTTALIGGIGLLTIFMWLAISEWNKWYNPVDVKSVDKTEGTEGGTAEPTNTKDAPENVGK